MARHPWEFARLEVLCDWLRHYLDAPGPVLDVGCGDGFVISSVSSRFQRRGFGVDNAWEGGVASVPSGVRVTTTLDDLPEIGQPAAILLMDVLEHLENPQDLLSELRQRGLIGIQTTVFVTVPAFQRLFSKHDEFLGHYRRYSRTELEALLRQSGLEPVRSGYFFLSLFIVRWLQCLRERAGLVSTEPSGVAEWKSGALATALIIQVLKRDARLTRWLKSTFGFDVPGLSCYAICQLAR